MYTQVQINAGGGRHKEFYVLTSILDEFIDLVENYDHFASIDVTTYSKTYDSDDLPYSVKTSDVIESLPGDLRLEGLLAVLEG